MCREMCTDSDNFGVTFAAGTTAEQKAAALVGAFLVDYMFFERDVGVCSLSDGFHFTCCLCSCFGLVVPCTFTLTLQGGSGEHTRGGGGGGPMRPENAIGAPACAESAVGRMPPMQRGA